MAARRDIASHAKTDDLENGDQEMLQHDLLGAVLVDQRQKSHQTRHFFLIKQASKIDPSKSMKIGCQEIL